MSVRSLRYNTIEQHFTKGVTASTDRDALAFLEAAQIYNANEQRAIVNLVRSLKRVGLWSKMKAIYPFVGGTASSHKWNLKDPRDADAAFRLTFSGGWTHSANGADPNGTNAWADTFVTPTTHLTQNSTHLSYYSREDSANFVEIGATSLSGSGADRMLIATRTGTVTVSDHYNYNTNRILVSNNANGQGYFVASRTSSTSHKLFRNNVQIGSTNTNASSGWANLTVKVLLARISWPTVNDNNWSDKQCAFATIGDGLTDTDATNLYNIVQRYQFQLGRAIEPDAQAFIDAAGITDATQQAAILDLVVRLKNDGLWSKMKAIYPFVGGTATTHKFNLKDPRDADAAFRLTFSGGWTHSNTGATPNGTNAYADTFLKPFLQMNASSYHQSFYSRTNSDGVYADMLGANASISEMVSLYLRLSNIIYADIGLYTSSRISATNTDSKGYYISTRTSSTSFRLRKNNTQLGSNTTTDTANFPNFNVYIGAANVGGSNTQQYSNRECAFVTIGDGLTDTDATNLYNIVDLYQKRLGRAV